MKIFALFYLSLMTLLSINLEANDNCAAIKSYIYNKKSNTLTLDLKKTLTTIEGKKTNTISVLRTGEKMKAKISFLDENSEICPNELSFSRAESLNKYVEKKHQMNKIFDHPIAKNLEIKRSKSL